MCIRDRCIPPHQVKHSFLLCQDFERERNRVRGRDRGRENDDKYRQHVIASVRLATVRYDITPLAELSERFSMTEI